jgi:cytochrome c556
MNRSIGLATVLGTVFAISVSLTTIQGEQEGKPVETFMRAKLAHSQSILEGLAVENYDQIAKSAQALTLLSQEADWKVLQTAEYAHQSELFRRNTKALTEAARKHNLDGATLAYVQVTLNCVECHKHVRSVQQARLETPRSLPSFGLSQ